MSIISLETRLRKVEAAKRPPRGLFYVVWGSTPEEIERGIEDARRAGTVDTGELVVRAPWPFGIALPPNRWARDEISHFTHTEFTALMGPVDELCDRIADDAREELCKRGLDPDSLADPLSHDRSGPWDERTRHTSDAVLLRTVLAEPLDVQPTPMPEARFKLIVDYICALGLRANIRGSYAARDQLMEAAHASRH